MHWIKTNISGVVKEVVDYFPFGKQKVLKALDKNNLSFNAKKGIIMNIIDKVVGTRE